ncbi:MAG: flotillin family protein [Lentisphaerae bacterium]|jgi:uncharacterized membrane protein YqiK|nr:flotillin family protein [Lentisphaerota bacterium]MBT4820828.1 flotillin family protein [Lentisphaerota bacterium]MBT5604724.1 flotillin family protein [Lentisphaerota bacterium]MBT7058102.1 flotillin family protein [Lentisphaerota bacterium]MBT7841790.1 flotillin family protein [Lentisphaerota bacterium]
MNGIVFAGILGQSIGMMILGGALIFVGLMVLIMKFYRKVEQGKALIVNCWGDKVTVTFTGGVVYPIINKAEVMDISVKAMEIEREGKNGLICEDNIRADIRVTFYVRVNKTEDDVLKVAQAVGCARASARETLEELFQAKFSEALKTVGKQMGFITLFTERESFKEQIIMVIGEDLNGYKLEDVAIDYLEQTPLSSLEPDNILDSQGIRKIVDLTSTEAMATNEFRRNKERVIKQQDVETREKILELERQEADAEAKQHREIATVQARETAEAEKVQAEERLKAERAQIQTAEELAVAEQNKDRQVEVAAKAKERTIAVETERVIRDRELEEVERERLVALKSIEKEKAVEIEKKQIQDVIRERVMVERTVAEEQEKIKDTVEIAGAERERKTRVIAAERDAQELVVKEVKAAEAKEEAAKSLYEEQVTMAEASRIKAEKEGEAKKTLAAGTVAEKSAEGLADVRVQEAEANAIELRGKAEAVAQIEGHKATAFGTETTGEAKAKAMTLEYQAEATGINQKADAMKRLDEVGRDHEEFKLELTKEERVELATIDVNRQIAEAQATVLAEAMKTAKIDIVGGDGEFLKNFLRSVSLAKSVDEFVSKSDEAQKLLDGDDGNIASRMADVLSSAGIGSDDVRNLSLANLMAKLGETKGGPQAIEGLREMMVGWLEK